MVNGNRHSYYTYTRIDSVYTYSVRQKKKKIGKAHAVPVNKRISLIRCKCLLHGCNLIPPRQVLWSIYTHFEYFGLRSDTEFYLICFLTFLFRISLFSFCPCPFRLFPSPLSSSSCFLFPLLLPLFLQLLGHYRHYLSLPKFRLSINLNYPIFFLSVLLLRSGLDNIYIYIFSFGKFPSSLKSIRLRRWAGSICFTLPFFLTWI